MNLGLPLSTLFAFVFVLARVAAVVAFLPMPMFRAAPARAKAVLAVVLTLTLFPVWPDLPNQAPSIGALLRVVFLEAGFGLTIGVALSLLLETFQVALQIIGLQAGYGYSLTVDPSSQADSAVLQVAFGLVASLLVIALGIDRDIIRLLAASLSAYPPGTWTPTGGTLNLILDLGSTMLITGLRLAFPVAALLLLIDIALALLGRMQQQLQLITLAFPVKMLVAIVTLAVIAPAFPRIFSDTAARMLVSLRAGIGL